MYTIDIHSRWLFDIDFFSIVSIEYQLDRVKRIIYNFIRDTKFNEMKQKFVYAKDHR